MTRKEIIVLLTLLSQTYESFEKRMDTDEKVETMINLWQECLGDLDFRLVENSVKKSIMQSPYPPTIYDIRQNAIATINPTEDNALKEWDECYKMICSGSYMTQEEFDNHSEICKRFLGSLMQLKAYATNEDFNMDVVRSNFLKQYEILKKRERENKLIPTKMRDLINKFANSVDIKKITE